MIGFINYPLYAIYRMCVGSVEGVILFFRIMHVIISAIVAVIWYFSFRKKTFFGAILSAIVYFSFSRSSINGISYYKVSVTCAVVIIILLKYIVEHNLEKKISYRLVEILLGITISYELLSMPYMLLGFVIMAVYLFFSEKMKISLIYKDVFWVMLGALGIGILFCHFAISWQVMSVLNNLTNILAEPGHNRGFIGTIYDGLYTFYAYGKIRPIVFGAVILAVELLNRKKNKGKHDIGFVLLILFLFIDLVLSFGRDGMRAEEGFEYIDIAFIVGPFLLLRIKRENFFEKITILTGIMLAFSYFIGSNTGISATTNGMIVVVMGSILFFSNRSCVCSSNYIHYKIAILGIITVITMVCVGKHINYVYRDESIEYLTTHINDGIFKGLYTTEEQYKQIFEISETINELNDLKTDKKLLISSNLPWGYILYNGKCGSPSVWGVNLTDYRIKKWNDSNDKYAEYLLLLEENVGGYLYNSQPDYSSELLQWNLVDKKEYVSVYSK